MTAEASFSRLVTAAMLRRGLGLRELCRRAEVDPSFFSKVLAGKRSPPSDEGPLRRLALALELDPVELIVSAGRIPTDWGALWSDSELVRAVHTVATGRRPAPRRVETAPPAARPPRTERSFSPPSIMPGRGLSEELL
jgi:transcriptional regulator with XRE-family HTH domain